MVDFDDDVNVHMFGNYFWLFEVSTIEKTLFKDMHIRLSRDTQQQLKDFRDRDTSASQSDVVVDEGVTLDIQIQSLSLSTWMYLTCVGHMHVWKHVFVMSN